MGRVSDLTELKLEELWPEVRESEKEWWDDLKAQTLRLVKKPLQSATDEEFLDGLPASRSGTSGGCGQASGKAIY